MARPTKFTAPLGATICKRICEGESLRSVCRDEKMPNRSTVHEWIILGLAEDAKPLLRAFSDQYEKAIIVRAENMFDEMEDIADDGSNDYMMRTGRDGEEYEVLNAEHVQRSRLRVDVRKWKLSKMLPKKFGDRQVVTTEDENGKTVPIKANVITFVTNDNG